MFATLNSIKTIQLDHTNRCNLLCPQCARVSISGASNITEFKDLSINDYKLIFSNFDQANIKILHCGNFGDVLASPTFDGTFDWAINHGFTSQTIITNGSLRNKKWWQNMARHSPKVKIVFSIDGLRDTNSIYRVNSNFDKIIDNLTAFCDAGGYARWDFIEFAHNSHQIHDAIKLAKMIGVKEFNLKTTSRFTINSIYNDMIITRNGDKLNDPHANSKKILHKNLARQYGSFDQYCVSNQCNIACKSKKSGTLYIDFDMRVWPCCWVGGANNFENTNKQHESLLKMLSKYPTDFNKLSEQNTLNDILSSQWFFEDLETSWTNGQQLNICGRTCGGKYEFSSGHGANTIKTIL